MWEEPRTVREMLKRNVLDFPDREAFVSVLYRTGQWVRHTWKEMDQISDRIATGLYGLGIRKGQKVAFLQNNSAECYYTCLGIHKIGAVFIPINVRLVAREVEYIVHHSDAEFIIMGSEFIPIYEQMRDKLKNIKGAICIEREGETMPDGLVSFTNLLNSTGTLPETSITPDDEADFIYTSGTTGRPKGVVFTHANKVATGKLAGVINSFQRNYYKCLRLQNAAPFYSSTGGSSITMSWLYYGFTEILEPTFDVVQCLETIEKEKTTHYLGVPSLYIFMMDHPRFREFDLSSLRFISFGGFDMPEKEIIRILDVLPGVKICNVYALTEAGPGGTFMEIFHGTKKLSSIGLPWIPDQELRIVDDQGRDAGVGEIGEILVRGPNVMKGYYKDPEATKEALRNGWLYTGDLGSYDDDGFFYYMGRKKDMIVRGGFNVYAMEVENALLEHPAVKECAVVGKPHPKLGEDILAFVVLVEGNQLSADEAIRFCEDRLADFKRPREILFLGSLPVTSAGKVDKKALRADYLNI